MSVFLKKLLFALRGGIPTLARYEARRAALLEKYERYCALKQTDNMMFYRELSVQKATPRRQSGLTKKEWKSVKREFNRVRKTEEVLTFFKLQKKYRSFRSITDWELKFEDSFSGSALDAKKWLDHYYVKGAGLNTSYYSPADENHVYTSGANVSVSDQTLKIVTKNESAAGLGFSEAYGFVPVERKYTSGIVNTGGSYRMEQGRVEAKIRFKQPSKGIYHAVWLGSGKRLPHVNIMRIGKKLEFSVFAEGQASGHDTLQYVSLWSRRRLRQNAYYIVELEWNADCITWRVNGVTMLTTPNIVKEPMFIAFSSGVTGARAGAAPALLEVDWVKAYQRNELAV
jgi:beta-glucanase (GH16 family)